MSLRHEVESPVAMIDSGMLRKEDRTSNTHGGVKANWINMPRFSLVRADPIVPGRPTGSVSKPKEQLVLHEKNKNYILVFYRYPYSYDGRGEESPARHAS